MPVSLPSRWPEEFLKSAFMFKLPVQLMKVVKDPHTRGKEQCSHGRILPHQFLFMSFIQFISSRSFCSSGKKNPPTLFHRAFPQLPQGSLASSLDIMSARHDVFSGCPAFRVVGSFAYCSKLGSGLPIDFRGFKDFPGGPEGKASVYNAGDPDSSHGLGRSLGEGNGNPLQYCCLENPMDRGAW